MKANHRCHVSKWNSTSLGGGGDSPMKKSGMLIVLLRGRLLARWVSRQPVDGHFLNKIVSFFRCCLINCSF